MEGNSTCSFQSVHIQAYCICKHNALILFIRKNHIDPNINKRPVLTSTVSQGEEHTMPRFTIVWIPFRAALCGPHYVSVDSGVQWQLILQTLHKTVHNSLDVNKKTMENQQRIFNVSYFPKLNNHTL